MISIANRVAVAVAVSFSLEKLGVSLASLKLLCRSDLLVWNVWAPRAALLENLLNEPEILLIVTLRFS